MTPKKGLAEEILEPFLGERANVVTLMTVLPVWQPPAVHHNVKPQSSTHFAT